MLIKRRYEPCARWSGLCRIPPVHSRGMMAGRGRGEESVGATQEQTPPGPLWLSRSVAQIVEDAVRDPRLSSLWHSDGGGRAYLIACLTLADMAQLDS